MRKIGADGSVTSSLWAILIQKENDIGISPKPFSQLLKNVKSRLVE